MPDGSPPRATESHRLVMDKLKQDRFALRFWQITAALMTGLAEFDYNLDAQTKDHSSSIKIRFFSGVLIYWLQV